jgi:hypothetical protein
MLHESPYFIIFYTWNFCALLDLTSFLVSLLAYYKKVVISFMISIYIDHVHLVYQFST